MAFNVFISWSGDRSRAIAEALYNFIPDVIQHAVPWMSSIDIDRGRRWSLDLANVLRDARIGIICLTPENVQAPWILFESGALASKLETGHVCPYLLGLGKKDVQLPLSEFQLTDANQDETLALMDTLNRALGSPIDLNRLRRTFARSWPDLSKVLQVEAGKVTANQTSPLPGSTEAMLAELLERVRRPAPLSFSPPQDIEAADPYAGFTTDALVTLAEQYRRRGHLGEFSERTKSRFKRSFEDIAVRLRNAAIFLPEWDSQ